MGPKRALVQMYKPGEEVPHSGIYRVRHYGHHHDHEVTCISGESFPECQKCRGKVRFSLIIAAHAVERHPHFGSDDAEEPKNGGLHKAPDPQEMRALSR